MVNKLFVPDGDFSLSDLASDLLSDIDANSYTTLTHEIEVSVSPTFIGSQSSLLGTDDTIYSWIYHVKIINNSKYPVKLINRYWKIIDQKGLLQEVEGSGVIGKNPTINPGQNFQYSSSVNLAQPSGIMKGRYGMKGDKASILNVEIPTFPLDIPNFNHTLN